LSKGLFPLLNELTAPYAAPKKQQSVSAVSLRGVLPTPSVVDSGGKVFFLLVQLQYLKWVKKIFFLTHLFF